MPDYIVKTSIWGHKTWEVLGCADEDEARTFFFEGHLVADDTDEEADSVVEIAEDES